jgi:hypothetical protein
MASTIKTTKGMLLVIYCFVVSVDHVDWRKTLELYVFTAFGGHPSVGTCQNFLISYTILISLG